jgi:hypothetical protein
MPILLILRIFLVSFDERIPDYFSTSQRLLECYVRLQRHMLVRQYLSGTRTFGS